MDVENKILDENIGKISPSLSTQTEINKPPLHKESDYIKN